VKPGKSQQIPLEKPYAEFCMDFFHHARCWPVRPESVRDCASTGYKRGYHMNLGKMPHALETQPERDGSPETDANVGGDSAVDSDTASIASTLKGVVDADVAEDLVQRLLDNLPKPELSPLCEKEEQFSNYIGKRVKTFTSDIVKPLVSSLEQLGSQMNKDRLKEHLNGYATMLEEVLFGDKETDKPPPEGKRAKPANHVLAKFLRAGAPHPEGKSGEALQKAWSESLDIFADDITDEIRKTMPVAKKIAWKNFVRPKLDNTRSIELGIIWLSASTKLSLMRTQRRWRRRLTRSRRPDTGRAKVFKVRRHGHNRQHLTELLFHRGQYGCGTRRVATWMQAAVSASTVLHVTMRIWQTHN